MATTNNETCEATQSPDSAPTHDTPNHVQKWAAAAAVLEKQATKMRKTVTAVTEQDLPVGEVILVQIDKVDCSKVCPKRLPCIVIEKVHDKYQLACRTGVLANCLVWQDFMHEPRKTPVFYELDKAVSNWKFFRSSVFELVAVEILSLVDRGTCRKVGVL